MALNPDERAELERLRRDEIHHRQQQSRSQLSDEMRMCAGCGWKIRKSEAMRLGIKVCPRCAGDRIVAQSMDFNMTPEQFPNSLRNQMNRRGGG